MTDPTKSRYKYLSFKDNSVYRRYAQERESASLQQDYFHINFHEIPTHGTYGALLFDPRWKVKREEILKRDSYTCVICNSKESVQVHHRQYHFVIRNNQYKAPWEYENYLLITLCESCHKKGHNKYKVPTIIM